MLLQFLAWYLVVQLITLVTLPLTVTLFANVPDRGYAFAKILGILLVGFTLWLGTAYGLLRNETGGAWLALVVVAVISVVLGQGWLQSIWRERKLALPWGNIVAVELLFLAAFVAWTAVRAYDPAANHTEQPMDLMFMNSIWVSPTFPPHDAWLSGYAISYYYFGYWLLATLGRLAGQPPEIAYNLGQTCWFALLLTGCFGVVANLLLHGGQRLRAAVLGGLLAAFAVGLTGNLWGLFEWLYAHGTDVTGITKWFAVNNFPQTAPPAGAALNFDWWRSSRVISDLTLTGDHIEVIDEFPIFSYILGDNHPHVLAMPIALLVIGLAQNLFFGCFVSNLGRPTQKRKEAKAQEAEPAAEKTGLVQGFFELIQATVPLGVSGYILLAVAVGALVFLNTWDFPPYWLLLGVSFLAVSLRSVQRFAGGNRLGGRIVWLWTGAFSLLLLIGSALLYVPYFLTAQSQAGGFLPNLFNPTRFSQFFLMFGYALLGVGALLALAWAKFRPSPEKLMTTLALIYGAPLTFLLVSLVLGVRTASGQAILSQMALPPGATSYVPLIVGRWSKQGLTFLVLGALLAVLLAWLWHYFATQLTDEQYTIPKSEQSLLFALLLAAIGLLLVYAPEFVYLRDNFGTRMNTIFKFYYQGWLLFGLSSSYAVIASFSRLVNKDTARQLLAPVCSGLCLVCMALGVFYPVAALDAKTNSFAADKLTLDATAYIAQSSPAEMAAARWIRDHTTADALIAEALGRSYYASDNRMSTLSGRPTLHGWGGHESQWRGKAYGEMAQNRDSTLRLLYQTGSTTDIAQALRDWKIDYVYVGPAERDIYKMQADAEDRLKAVMDLAFEQGDVRIYQRRNQ